MPVLTQRRVSIVRQEAPAAWWELATTEIDPPLREHVLSWCGFREWTAVPVRRREVPAGIIPVIIDFEGSYRVISPREPMDWTRYQTGFAAGMHDSFALTDLHGQATGMQVNFTPIGGWLFLGLPLSELTNSVVAFGDLFGAAGRQLVERLREAPDWETRFDLLEAFIVQRLTSARAPAPGVLWAWQRLAAAGGQVDIGGLALELGCSRKHLITQFREQIGAPPKTIARILRFQAAVRLFHAGTPVTGADVALACGYFDQAHFIKDFRAFSGLTPTEYQRHILPGLESISAD